ncbi:MULTISPECIES: hypothetical protein [unclassified Bacillus (in: firmicutes)]|uniref:hypothetical protein n=1 Tax=unclassified Bacillus (in: firmicutes) TaxID=185979 RepID=UPI001BEA0942|nr:MULTISPECIES: hypothetical protein [unclassified Bacillus (in: firmicutes)]MBT2725106.1 hypothetical protein [Bacillus sp. ISL-46]MBT2744409.1 hypothetical protein [Bacillus sp. ISL-77]
MVQLTPFMYTPRYAPDKPFLVYSVNCDSPETTIGFIQGCWKCTHCGKGNQFRFYVNSKNRHLAKCPDCNEEFVTIEE